LHGTIEWSQMPTDTIDTADIPIQNSLQNILADPVLTSEVWGGILYTNSSQFTLIVSMPLRVLPETKLIYYVSYKKYEFDAFFSDKWSTKRIQ
jgi:hypothetical protein